MNVSLQVSSDEILSEKSKSPQSFIDTIPQNYLLICILILFIIFLFLIIIILICLIKKRKKFLQTETIVNNNIDINKMILQNSKNNKLKDFQSLQNNSNYSGYSEGLNNLSLNDLKRTNLKEEIHNIVSETLSEMTLNKARKLKRKKMGNQKRKSGQISLKIEPDNEGTNKELNSKK